ncbi:hypothetical protein M8037_22170 [Sinorhizobium meliloti]|uniref:hypothetical protein n=1 Tax=Rhizobium meliloti TaxID=382 RepID=UPI0020738B95|nr:hypothetical protein [Sinorhizobium meliloti]MCM5691434.1 hypothetical protein [Sinorhizobium meliloti]
MNTIAINEFDAEYRVKYSNGTTEWFPCRVVGVHVPDAWSEGQFIIMTEDDEGITYAGTANAIKRS